MEKKFKRASWFGIVLALSCTLISCSPKSDDKKASSPQEDLAAKARQEADSAACLVNLKEIGKALRAWADKHDGAYPKDFILATNELGNLKILHCPGDHTRTTGDLEQLKSGDLSYHIVSIGPNALATNLDLVLVQCVVHGSVFVSDGTAHAGSAEFQKRLKPTGDGTVHLMP
jgi:hypothetical protein